MLCRKTQSGFTLLEILISVAIFALISSAVFVMLQQTLKTAESFELKSADLVELQRAYRLFQQDFSQVVPRPIRDEFGDVSHAMYTEEESWGTAIEFSRNGRPNPLNKPRSAIERVRYFLDGDNLIRRNWQHLDRAPQAEFQDRIILEGIQFWQLRLMSGQQNWFDLWPTDDEDRNDNLPEAVEITFSTANEREGQIRWLFSMLPRESSEK